MAPDKRTCRWVSSELAHTDLLGLVAETLTRLVERLRRVNVEVAVREVDRQSISQQSSRTLIALKRQQGGEEGRGEVGRHPVSAAVARCYGFLAGSDQGFQMRSAYGRHVARHDHDALNAGERAYELHAGANGGGHALVPTGVDDDPGLLEVACAHDPRGGGAEDNDDRGQTSFRRRPHCTFEEHLATDLDQLLRLTETGRGASGKDKGGDAARAHAG